MQEASRFPFRASVIIKSSEASQNKRMKYPKIYSIKYPPGLTLHGYLSKILARSCQDLRTIVAKILSRSCHGTHFAMVRSYQESHVPKKNFIVKSYLARQNLKGSQQKSISMQIYIVTRDNFLFPRCKT